MSSAPLRPSHLSPSINGEVPFSFDELFFSRTDERGIILSGNSVFERISMYSWGELLRKPHNIIRHPDMPKAVFWLLWETIKAGQPIGAYVKNRAKDGRYYWVFAIVTPVDGGYLSVRLKPSSPVFDIVQQEYAALLAKENAGQMKPAESGALLLERLRQLGFPNYNAFMSAALSHEILARDKQLRRAARLNISIFDHLVELSTKLLKQAEIVFSAYSLNEYVPLNLRVQAARLGESGRTIGVISNSYNVISEEIKQGMDEFMRSAQMVCETIQTGLFLVGTAEIQKEVAEHFHQESGAQDRGAENEREAALLAQQEAAYEQKALEGLISIESQANHFRESCLNMKRLVSALEVARIMGKVETARLAMSDDGLTGLIGDLEEFQKTLTASLKEIETLNRNVALDVDRLLSVSTGRRRRR